MNEQQELIEQGLELIASLHKSSTPADSRPGLEQLENEIQQQLRVPVIDLFFRTLSHYPDYFGQLWQHIGPSLLSNSFEQEADNLREEALLETVPALPLLKWDKPAAQDELRACNDTYFYVHPKLLLLVTLFHEATFRGIPERRNTVPEAEQDTKIPAGVAHGTSNARAVDPENASEEIRQLFESVKKQHTYPLVPQYYSSLANWPQFLHEAWLQIMPLVGTPDYENLKEFLVYQAQTSLRKLSIAQPAITTPPTSQKEELRTILAAFRYKLIPELLIDNALIKALLDGKEEAYTSCFSFIASDEPEDEG